MADYDRELIIDMLAQYQHAIESGSLDSAGQYHAVTIAEQIDLLREADNRESRAQTVCNPDSAAHDGGDDPKNDREALLYLMQQFDAEAWNCDHCGHSEATKDCDSAEFLREYLATHPATPIADACKPDELLEVADAMEGWANLHQSETGHSGPIQINPESLRTWANRIRDAMAMQDSKPRQAQSDDALEAALDAYKKWHATKYTGDPFLDQRRAMRAAITAALSSKDSKPGQADVGMPIGRRKSGDPLFDGADAYEAHLDDLAVDQFAAAMKAKLAEARAKGRGGWNDDEDLECLLSNLLREHVEKGDPRDVANFCCFLWNRGESIAAACSNEGNLAEVDVDARARELLAAEYERNAQPTQAELLRSDWYIAGSDKVAVAAIISSLSGFDSNWDEIAYATMRDDLEAWKMRAFAAEADIVRMCEEFNAENGPMHMGEPVLKNSELINQSLDSAWRNILTTHKMDPLHPDVAAVTIALATFAARKSGQLTKNVYGFVFDEALCEILARIKKASKEDKPAIVREAIEKMRNQRNPEQVGVEARARDLLSQEYERDGYAETAYAVKSGWKVPNAEPALRAITAALSSPRADVGDANQNASISGGDGAKSCAE